MNIKQTQKGFTLIELMIVIAIIGILAAVALPAYSDYTNRAKMSEVILAASVCRTEVTEIVQTNSALQTTPLCESANPTSKYVASVAVSAAGVITVTTQNLVAGSVLFTPYLPNGTTPVAYDATAGWSANAIGIWGCSSGEAALLSLLPSSCRI